MWKCELCPVNHFKVAQGNDVSCKQCTGKLSIDHGKRTACIDPYQEIAPDIWNAEFTFTFSISTVGLGMTLLVILVFLNKRETPIVRLSDFKLSIFHLSINGVIFITLPISFSSQTLQYELCVMRVSVVSIFYTLNIGIVFIKSQKLLQAFLSKVRKRFDCNSLWY